MALQDFESNLDKETIEFPKIIVQLQEVQIEHLKCI